MSILQSTRKCFLTKGYESIKRIFLPFYYYRTKRNKVWLRVTHILLFFFGFVYLNYRFNLPVFHVFRNQNIQEPCVLPTFDLYDSSVAQFFWKQQPLPCENWLDLFFVDEKGYITMNETATRISGFGEIKCEYKYIKRVSETEMTFSSKMLYTQPTYLKGDFIHMECYDTKNLKVYNNLHVNIDKSKRQLLNETLTQLSVYIVGIDSVSRLIAERKLQKTMNYLRKNLGAYILKGYTRIADSSYPNIVPIFTGLKAGVEDRVGVNDLPYIFKEFTRRGSVDLWAEDWYTVASFKGFKEQPTHHYIQPLIQAMDMVRPSYLPLEMTLKFLQNHNIPLRKVSAMCFGNVYRFKILLQYYKRFIEAYDNKRKFGFLWINEIAHDFFNMVELADDDYFELIKWMKDTNKLDNAILIVMGDHGPRYSEIQNTEVGRVSNLLPLMTIVVPDHIKSKFPHIHKNLKTNSERLTTAYDVYEMLKNVLNEDFEEKNSISDKKTIPRGISLFQEIPSSRSCMDADISEHYCPCYSSKNMSTDDSRIIASTHFLVSAINDILKNDQSICAQVKLSSIKSASFVFADMQRDSQKERSFSLRSVLWRIEERTRFRIQFQTNPGNAMFEATVQYSEDNILLLGDINRINSYGNQSVCIEDIKLQENRIKRLYCYCK